MISICSALRECFLQTSPPGIRDDSPQPIALGTFAAPMNAATTFVPRLQQMEQAKYNLQISHDDLTDWISDEMNEGPADMPESALLLRADLAMQLNQHFKVVDGTGMLSSWIHPGNKNYSTREFLADADKIISLLKPNSTGKISILSRSASGQSLASIAAQAGIPQAAQAFQHIIRTMTRKMTSEQHNWLLELNSNELLTIYEALPDANKKLCIKCINHHEDIEHYRQLKFAQNRSNGGLTDSMQKIKYKLEKSEFAFCQKLIEQIDCWINHNKSLEHATLWARFAPFF